VYGPEVFLRTLYTQQLKDALNKAHGNFDVLHFDGASAPAADVLDECRSFGLMAQHKLVIVDNADQFVKEANRPLVERYAENPSDGATLLLRADKWNKGKLDTMIEEVGAIIHCEQPREAEAQAWAITRCQKRYNAPLEKQAAAMLVERLGPDLGRIDSELAKLTTAAEEGKPVTPELVREFTGTTREDDAWSIQQVLFTGEPERAIRRLRDILDISGESNVPVSFAMMDLARKLHGVCAGLKSGMKPGELVRPFRFYGFIPDSIVEAARRCPSSVLAALLADCVAADVRQKSGLGEPGRTLEMNVLRFTHQAFGVAAE
jgi:DNA polymerase III subunit delta